MKKQLFTVLFICSIVFTALGKTKIDSVYYLLDTTKTPMHDRLWDIREESNPSMMLYTIKCPCLQFGNNPIFVYNLGLIKDAIVSQEDIANFKLANLSTLIADAKRMASDTLIKRRYTFFLIEPVGLKFIVREVRLLHPLKPRSSTIDYIIVPASNSIKNKKNKKA